MQDQKVSGTEEAQRAQELKPSNTVTAPGETSVEKEKISPRPAPPGGEGEEERDSEAHEGRQ